MVILVVTKTMQRHSERMDVIYSNTTDTIINNKGSSTSRSISINNTKKQGCFV